MNWVDYLERVEDPDHPAMRDLLETARNNVREQLLEEGAEEANDGAILYRGTELDDAALTKFSYTFYHDWWDGETPKFVFLVQNPGPLVSGRHLDDEADDLLKAVGAEDSYRRQVRVNQGYLEDWLWRRNQRFSEGFFPVLSDHGLISYDSLKGYLRGDFFDDFVLTDVVKYRVSTGEIDGGVKGNAEVSYDEYLYPELEALDPDLIFSFGSRCWKVLLRNLDLDAVGDGELTDTVTNAHGHAFRSDDWYVIPLTHFSGRNTFLRDSYYEYLSEGIEQIIPSLPQ